MAEQKKYIEKTVLQSLLTKIVERNDARYLKIGAEAISAAKVAHSLKITVGDTEVSFNGSSEQTVPVAAAKVHEHKSTDITDFANAVNEVIAAGGGTSHTHENLEVLKDISAEKVAAWDGKIGTADAIKLAYINSGMSQVTNVKDALDVLTTNAQINSAALSSTSSNMNTLSEKIDSLETRKVDKVEGKSLVADTEIAKIHSHDNKTVLDNLTQDVIDKAHDHANKAELDKFVDGDKAALDKAVTDIAAINNETTGILAQAKTYAKEQADGKDTAIAEAKKAGTDAQAAVDTLAGKVGTVEDGKTVVELIATAQAQADKGVSDAAAEKERAEGVESGLRADLGTKADEANAGGSAFARIAQVKADLAAEVTRATNVESGLRTDVDAAQDAIDTLNGDDQTAGSVDKKIKDAIDEVNSDAEALAGRVTANENAIATLNGDSNTKGSVKKAIADVIGAAPENMDTLKELADAITAHQSVYEAYIETVNGQISTAKSEAIAAAASDATEKDNALKTALETEIGKKVDQSTYDTKIAALEKADTDNLAAAKKYADDEDAKIEAILGTKAEDETPATGLCADVAANTTAIATEKTRAEAAEGALDTRVTALEDKVGDDSEGLVKDVADLQTSQETQDTEIATLKGLVGTKADGVAADTAFGRIAKNTADISDINTEITNINNDIDSINLSLSEIGTLEESELDAMLNQAYGVTQE